MVRINEVLDPTWLLELTVALAPSVLNVGQLRYLTPSRVPATPSNPSEPLRFQSLYIAYATFSYTFNHFYSLLKTKNHFQNLLRFRLLRCLGLRMAYGIRKDPRT